MPPIFTRDIQRTLLWNTCILPFEVPLQDFHPLWCGIPANFGFVKEEVTGSTHHMSPAFQQEIRFALYRFLSPVLTASLLLSLPAGTKMLQFPAFPIPCGIVTGCRDRKSYSVISGSKAPCAYPEHIAAWHDLPQHLSRAIPQMVSQLFPSRLHMETSQEQLSCSSVLTN
jgi:hypothetical protein